MRLIDECVYKVLHVFGMGAVVSVLGYMHVSECVCVYIHACILVYVCVCVDIYIYMGVFVNVCLCTVSV